jgi:hypothetical protein
MANKIIKAAEPSGDEEKISTAEHAEIAERFLQETQKMNHFMNIPSSLRPPGSLRFVVLFSFRRKKSFFLGILRR